MLRSWCLKRNLLLRLIKNYILPLENIQDLLCYSGCSLRYTILHRSTLHSLAVLGVPPITIPSYKNCWCTFINTFCCKILWIRRHVQRKHRIWWPYSNLYCELNMFRKITTVFLLIHFSLVSTSRRRYYSKSTSIWNNYIIAYSNSETDMKNV